MYIYIYIYIYVYIHNIWSALWFISKHKYTV